MGINTRRSSSSISVHRNGLAPSTAIGPKPTQEGGTTSPTLLGRAADWRDLPAWREMFDRYDSLLRRWCRGYGLDDSSVEEVCQRVWVELANRLRTFRYDPRKTFRGWLRELCRSRAIDLVRQRQREGRNVVPLEKSTVADDGLAYDQRDEEFSNAEHAMLREAERAQAAVQERVGPRTWDAYWRIAIENQTVRETATALGMSYAAAFAACSRVHRKLRDEGTKRLPALLAQSTPESS